MREIALSGERGKGLFALVDEEDYADLSKYVWYLHSAGYAVRRVKHQSILMHRELFDLEKGQLIDHVNRNKLDNRRNNLRIADKSRNGANTPLRKTNTSGYRGVIWAEKNKKWRAEITYQYKNQYLGIFATPEEAARAYDQKALELFGEFATLNFNSEDVADENHCL